MIKKRYSLRIWVFLFLINGLVLSTGFSVLIRQNLVSLRTTAQNQTEQNLRTFAHSLRVLFPSPPVDIDAFVKSIANRDPGFRITVVASDGTVIGDSDAPDITKLENHAHRPEIKAALQGSEGKDIHRSSVNIKDVMYYAVPLDYGGEHMALRLSMPVDTSVYFSSSVRNGMLFSCICVFVFVLFVSFLVSAHIVKQITSLQKASEQYRNGNFSYRPYIQSPRELEELGESIETMAQTIEKNMLNITGQRDEFQAVFSGITEALIVFDSNMVVLEYNGIVSRLFDYYAELKAGKNPETLAQVVQNSEILKLADEAVHSDCTGKEIEAKLHPHIGDRDVLVRCTEIKSRGLQKRFLLVLTDITRLKKLEQIRTDFVANVSHELKTPVTSIKGFTETLLDGALDDRETAFHFLEIMDAQSGRLINIIEDLLTLSRLEQENRPPETALANLADVVRQVCRSFEKDAEKKRIRISFKEPSLPEKEVSRFTADVNAGLISQAVGNIIDNAVKYCPDGSVIDCLIERNETQSKPVANIVIEDNGTGIPVIYRDRIFERFFRVDKGRSREQGGTGLGLSITAHIIKLHGGTVRETERTDGKPGARFEIILPLI